MEEGIMYRISYKGCGNIYICERKFTNKKTAWNNTFKT